MQDFGHLSHRDIPGNRFDSLKTAVCYNPALHISNYLAVLPRRMRQDVEPGLEPLCGLRLRPLVPLHLHFLEEPILEGQLAAIGRPDFFWSIRYDHSYLLRARVIDDPLRAVDISPLDIGIS